MATPIHPALVHPRFAARSAFTVLEVLMASALTAILMTAMGYALTAMIAHMNVNDGTIQARQATQSVLDQISTRIRLAKLVQLKPAGALNNDYSRLEILGSGDWDDASNSYINQKWTVFAVSGDSLTVGQGATPNPTSMTPVLTGVSSMVFHGVPDSNNVISGVNVQLTLQKKNFGAGATGYSLASSANIRALSQ